MADQPIKYISFDNLSRYDGLIKTYVNNAVNVVGSVAEKGLKIVALNEGKLQFFTEIPPLSDPAPTPAYEITLPTADVEQIKADLEQIKADIETAKIVADEAKSAADSATQAVTNFGNRINIIDSAVEKLDGGENIEGSIKNQISSLKTTLETEIANSSYDDTELAGKVSTLETKLGSLDEDVTIPELVTSAKQEAINAAEDKINEALSSVFSYKGTKASLAEVQAIQSPKNGDVWFVSADNSEYVYIKEGDADGIWEKLGTTVNLSNYATISYADQTASVTTLVEKNRAEAAEKALSDRIDAIPNADITVATDDEIDGLFS